MATARKPAESPRRPTETTMWAVSTVLRARRPNRLRVAVSIELPSDLETLEMVTLVLLCSPRPQAED
jgi:hypothetical protein